MMKLEIRRLWIALLCSAAFAACGGEPAAEAADVDARLASGPLAASREELSKEPLAPAQQQTVLQLIDNICGDTWCEGDHNFRFDRLKCKAPCQRAQGTCTLTFRMFPHDSDIEAGPTFTRTCKTGGFTGFASLVNTSASGYQSLNWDYYEALTACIGELEQSLPAH